ncbi:MAG: zinc dependent phospholipase C family protein [Fidelibacterota bacterium]
MRLFKRTFFWILPLVLINVIFGWGYDVHKRINYKAAQILEGPLGEFTQRHADILAIYGPVPDYIKSAHSDEFYRHFIDADLYGDYPFTELIIDYKTLVDKYGEDNIKKWGSAPWTIEETTDILIKMFKQERWDEVVFYMGYLGHYVADLHMPFHTCANYNGQFTGNDGVHFRWESRMVDKLIPQFEGKGDIIVIDHFVETALAITKESFSVYPQILSADSKARRHLTEEQKKELNTYKFLSFEDQYLTILFEETGDLAQDRLGRAATLTASFWFTCWKLAGSPLLPK